jgi:hypothetical protein
LHPIFETIHILFQLPSSSFYHLMVASLFGED